MRQSTLIRQKMFLQLPIKTLIVFLLASACCLGQNDVEVLETEDKPTISKTYYSYNFQYFIPQVFGDNALAKGTKGIGGINLKLQLGIYKGFFVGGNLGAAYLEVTNPEIVGNYKKSTVTNNYLFFGYEYYVSERFKLGLSAAPFAKTTYKNKIFDASEGRQYDTGNFFNIELYIDYKLSKQLAVFVSYTYRKDKLNIVAPIEYQSQFNASQFNHFGIGAKLCFGHFDIVSAFLK